MNENPYESPRATADIHVPTPDQAVNYKLYSPGQICFASFLGSIFAGCVLMAINYSRVGNRKLAMRSMMGGFFATVLLIMAASEISNVVRIPASVWAVASAAAMFQLADSLQGPMFRRHIHLLKGLRASSWKAAGIALVCALLIFLLIFAGVFIASLVWPTEDILAE